LTGLAAILLVASVADAWLQLGDRYLLKASGLFLGVMAVAIGLLPRHHPFDRFGLANWTTTARATLTALVCGFVGEPAAPVNAVAVTGAALAVTLLDGVDGWFARRGGLASGFGARFDMEVDALLLIAMAVLAWQFDKAGLWVLLSGLLRYLFVAAGWFGRWLARPLPASRRRQTVCVIQTGGLILACAPVIPSPASGVLAAIALCMLTWSFLVDVTWLWAHKGG
jgi:phosphatidylglycerophosphate synthase